ncbi:MAG: 50S ribosomal protein L25 [Opitutaceae bacterium]|jgi:large subunit ribosomal protein L25
MNTQLTLNVYSRTQTGRSASRRLRKANRVPAILYGKHTNPEKIALEGTELVKLLKAVGGRSVLIELQHPGRPEKALSILQEIQRDPITDKYLHVDLHEVKSDEKFEIEVPVHIVGESTGVKNESGVLEIASHTLKIRCLPKDLPAVISVDVTPLKVGDTIKVGEMKPIAGVEFLDHKGQPVVSCVEPVAEIVVEVPVAAEAVPVEGAVAPAEGEAAAAVPGAEAKPGAAPAGDAKGAGAAAPGKGAAPAAGAKGVAAGKAAAPAAGKAPAAAAGAKPAAPGKAGGFPKK